MSNTTISEMADRTGLSTHTLRAALIDGRLKGDKTDGQWQFTMGAFFEVALSGRFMPKGKHKERIRIAQNVIGQAQKGDKYKDKWIQFAKILTNDAIQRTKTEQKAVSHRLPSYHTTIRELATCLNFSIEAVSSWVRDGKIKKVGVVMSDKKCLDLFGRTIPKRTGLLSLDSFFKAVEDGKIEFIGRGKRKDNWRAEMVKALTDAANRDPANAEKWQQLIADINGESR